MAITASTQKTTATTVRNVSSPSDEVEVNGWKLSAMI